MSTGLTYALQESDQIIRGLKYKGLYGRTPATHYEHRIPYTETFDEFIDRLLGTDLLDKKQKQLLRGLRNQWEYNLKSKI